MKKGAFHSLVLYFDFHLFDFLGEVDMYRMSMCLYFIVSIPCHTSPSIHNDA